MSKEDKMKELTCYLLYKHYGFCVSPEEISSVFKHKILPDNILAILESKEFNDRIHEFEKRVTYWDNTRNPFGIFKTIRDYAHSHGVYIGKDGTVLNTQLIERGDDVEVKKIDHYKPDNPNEYVINIVDNLNILTPEKGRHVGLQEAIADFSSNYSLSVRDRWKYIICNVQQQALANESTENFKLDRLQPSANGLGDSKLSSRDCNLMIGLFSPFRNKISNYEGYDITKMKDNHRELSVILNRHGPAVNTHLYFNGKASYFSELPPADLFKEKPELYSKFN